MVNIQEEHKSSFSLLKIHYCDIFYFEKSDLMEKKEILLKINKYKRSDSNLEKALELCNNPDYQDDVSIQHQKMEILCMLKRYKEAIVIGERPEFVDEMSIQLKLVEAYMGLKDYDKAMAICERSDYANHPGFIQKAKRIKKDLFRINGSQVQTTSNDFNDYIETIDNLIAMAKQEKNPGRVRQLLRKAQGYCSVEEFKDNINAIIYRIKILKLLGEYQMALEIASNIDYVNNIDIFIQIISILTHLKKYDEALSLIEKSTFKDNQAIQNQRRSILLKKDKGVSKPSSNNDNGLKTVSFSDLLDYIESKKLSIDVIYSLNISRILKDILIIASFEVRDDKKSIYEYLNEMGINYQDSDECLKIVKDLEKHFSNDKVTYDRMLYQKLLIILQNIKNDNSRKNG